jgi:hypothetical protein
MACDFVDLAQKWLLRSPGSPAAGTHSSAISGVAHCVSADHQSAEQLLNV